MTEVAKQGRRVAAQGIALLDTCANKNRLILDKQDRRRGVAILNPRGKYRADVLHLLKNGRSTNAIE